MLCGCCTRHCCIRASLQCHMDDMLQLNAIRKICAASAAVLRDMLLPGNTQKLLLHSEQQLHHSKACLQLACVRPIAIIHSEPAYSVKKLHAACAAALDRTATPASRLNVSWDLTESSKTISNVCCLRSESLA